MNPVRTFVFCTSLLLFAWLSASYTSKQHAPGKPAKPVATKHETPAGDDQAEQLPTTVAIDKTR